MSEIDDIAAESKSAGEQIRAEILEAYKEETRNMGAPKDPVSLGRSCALRVSSRAMGWSNVNADLVNKLCDEVERLQLENKTLKASCHMHVKEVLRLMRILGSNGINSGKGEQQ